MPDFGEVFAKFDSHKSPARRPASLVEALDREECESRARERRNFWGFLLGVALMYAAVVLGTTKLVERILSLVERILS